MGNSSFSNSIQEKYLGDLIHENRCGMSITVTYEDRIRRLISKCTEIIGGYLARDKKRDTR